MTGSSLVDPRLSMWLSESTGGWLKRRTVVLAPVFPGAGVFEILSSPRSDLNLNAVLEVFGDLAPFQRVKFVVAPLKFPNEHQGQPGNAQHMKPGVAGLNCPTLQK